MKVKDGKEKGTAENTIVAGCYDPQRLRELAEADKDGRVKIFPPSADGHCGSCDQFRRVSGTQRGVCEARSSGAYRYGFVVGQSRKACKGYRKREEGSCNRQEE